MKIINRVYRNQPDYILTIVRPPHDWQARSVEDVPPGAVVLSRHLVASYAEAHDDLVRCNQLALKQELNAWATIQSPGAGL